jgi:hypothetical protein
MATGNIKGGRRNYARPTAPSTSTLTASTSIAAVDFSFTASTLGPAATSYVIGGTSNDGGATTSTVTTSTSGSATGFTGGKTYDVYVSARNYNGEGARTQTTSIVIPGQYELAQTFNTNGTYTIPSGKTKLAGVVVSVGGSGGTTGPGNVNTSAVGGGGGGGSGAIAAFWEFSVTAGQTATITVGSAGVASKVTYGGTDIATANAGGTSTNTTLTGGTGGSGGNAASNIATNISLTNGYAGRSGGNGGDGGGAGNSPSGGQALPTTEVTNFTTTSFTFSPNSNLTFQLGGGGGGGGGGHTNGNTPFGGANGGAGGSPSAANGNNRGGSGGEGGSANNTNLAGNTGSIGAPTNFVGVGGGGAGGSGAHTNLGRPNNSVAGGTGGPGIIYIYTR